MAKRTVCLATLTIALAGYFSFAAKAAEASRPNVVFILLDDMGYGEPACYRAASGFKTPNLDRLAREGMRFTDAHAAASVCTPTRYGILTGRYPARIGQFGVLTTYSAPIIERQRLTVASLLKQYGYHTACIGKWHLGMDWQRKLPDGMKLPIGTRLTSGPTTRGFDYFCGYTHAGNMGTVIEQDAVVMNVPDVEVQPLLRACPKSTIMLTASDPEQVPAFRTTVAELLRTLTLAPVMVLAP